MDGPPAMSLGVDPVSPDAMRRPPRPPRERNLTGRRFLRLLLTGVVMAAGTLAVLVWAPGPEPRLDEPTTAGTMAFASFVFFQAFNLLNVRDEIRSVFTRQALDNPSAFVATAAVAVLLALVVEMDVLHGVLTTTDLTSGQWLVCVAVGSVALWVGELVKWGLRLHTRRRSPSR
jgi:P-type Ca2+ transporter type 2C